MDEFDKEMARLLKEIEDASLEITMAYEDKGIKVKNSGFMCQNIFMVDFATQKDYLNGAEITLPKLVIRTTVHPTKKRIVYYF